VFSRRSESTHRIGLCAVAAALLSLAALGACAGGDGVTVVREGVGAATDEYLTAATPYGFSGALLVAKDGEVLLEKGYGMADLEAQVPNTASTVFTTGSITKQFTAAAILRLEMDGLLSTDDRLSEHLEGVPDDKKDITLHHLLTHTSGIVPSTGDDFEVLGRDDMVQRAMDAPLAFEPGTRMMYSNAGYSLLAAVVEVVSGQPYEEYLAEHIFGPAGMKMTGYRLPDWSRAVVAHWYRGETDNGTPLDKHYPYWNLIGNGGILSTLGDMFRWYEALKGDAVLSEAEKRKLWTPFLNDYGYGWDVLQTPRGTLVQHDGGSDLGASAELRWFVDEDVVTVLFCNRDFQGVPLFQVVRNEIEELTFGGEVVVPPPPVDIGGQQLDELAGNYRLPTGGGILVERDGSLLRLVTFDQDVINALFSPEADPTTYDDLNKRANKLVAAAVSGDHDAFVKELGDEALAQRVQDMLTDEIGTFARSSGAPPVAAVSLGSVPVDDMGTVMTGVRVRNTAGGADDMSLWWRDGRLVGLDQQGFQISIPMAPVTSTDFVGYSLVFARPMPVSFEFGDDGRVSSLRMGSHVAGRVGGTEHAHDHDSQDQHAGDVNQ
jgi:CubicO group peptidase (beta-lactamase class C family)